MGFFRGPNIVTDGLVLALDAANTKSYPGSGTTWSDLSGNNYTGTLTNSPTFNSANNGSISFDGTNDYTTLGNISTLDIGTSTLTCFVWIKTNHSSSGVFGKYQTDTGEPGWTINLSTTGKITAILKNSTGLGFINDSLSTINNNIWRQVAVVFRTSGIANTIYIDGTFDKNSDVLSGVITTNARSVLIGCTNLPTNTPGSFFNGNISNTLIYNRELSASEILQNYNALKSRFNLT